MLILAAGLLILLCIAFGLWPLLAKADRAASVPESSMRTLRRLFFRERLDELVADTPDAQLQAEMSDELGAVLLAEEDQMNLQPAVVATARTYRRGLIVSAVFVALIGIGIAMWRVDLGVLELTGAEAVMALPTDDKDALEAWRDRLAARALAAPGDSKSRYLLGHAELKLGRYEEAAEAFATTSALMPDDVTVQVYWLQARYLAQRGALDDIGRGLAQKILARQPNLPIVLEVLAMDSFRRGDMATAVTQLNQALAGAPDRAQQASFAAAIKQIREQMPQSPAGVSVDVETADNPPASATVFVIARPVGGGMPYAVVKRPAELSPFSVRLDDLVSMSEQRKLSAADEFEVVVRLSRSGVAMAAAGDWEWRSEPLSSLREQTDQPALKARLAPPG